MTVTEEQVYELIGSYVDLIDVAEVVRAAPAIEADFWASCSRAAYGARENTLCERGSGAIQVGSLNTQRERQFAANLKQAAAFRGVFWR